jgi:arylsulfatase A-like enzyme
MAGPSLPFRSHRPLVNRLRAVAFLLLLIAPGCTREATLESDRPNIVLVSIDSLRWDHVGSYGYDRPTTPFLDELAARGVRFQNAFSTTSWTLPSHAAMFTGLYDSTHGLVDNGMQLADEHLTLAEILRDEGYETVGFFGGPYLHPTFGLAQGFEAYYDCMVDAPELSSGTAVRRSITTMARHPSHSDVTGPRTVRRVTEWLNGRKAGPFFLFLHMWDVHYDYIPPTEYVEMYDADYTGELTGEQLFDNPLIHPEMPARDLEHDRAVGRADGRALVE